MRYISNTSAQQKEMLARIGAASVETLLANVPAKARLSRPLALPAAMAEGDLVRHLRRMAAKNASADDFACFLGAGSYDHGIPSPINHLISRGEFFTAYTPYQPEASQGTLRTIFEYQTMMAELTGMDVANASIYDGASSLAEGVLMAHAITGRAETAWSRGVNSLYQQVVETYCEGPDFRLKAVRLGDGVTDLDALRKAVTERTAAVVVQYPNFFGCLEDVRSIADIVVGEGQGLGVPMSFGGPNLGVFAARADLVRRMPGRLVGATVDKDGKRGFVLTLQTREQHIRREKATSNICTNVALCALMATIYVSILGKAGLRKVGELATAKAHYAAERFAAVPGVSLRFNAPFFKEFALTLPKAPDRVVKRLLKDGILAGVPLKTFDRAEKSTLLVAVTERRTKDEIDAYAAALAAAVA